MSKTMEKHIQIIGIMWIVLGGLSFLWGILIFLTLLGVSYFPELGSQTPEILRIVGISFGIFLWVLSAPKIICGIGLLKRMEWARILAIVLSFLSLLNIPFGTGLAIYSLVILFKDETGALFNSK
jgi:hypothetical protein